MSRSISSKLWHGRARSLFGILTVAAFSALLAVGCSDDSSTGSDNGGLTEDDSTGINTGDNGDNGGSISGSLVLDKDQAWTTTVDENLLPLPLPAGISITGYVGAIFNQDGTMRMLMSFDNKNWYYVDDEELTITYEVTGGNKIAITYTDDEPETETGTFSFSDNGNKLTMIQDETGDTLVFTKTSNVKPTIVTEENAWDVIDDILEANKSVICPILEDIGILEDMAEEFGMENLTCDQFYGAVAFIGGWEAFFAMFMGDDDDRDDDDWDDDGWFFKSRAKMPSALSKAAKR